MAGAIASGATNPFDVCNTRVMLNTRSPTSGETYDTVSGTLKMIIREEGVAGLTKGLLPRVAWMSIGAFVLFGSFETVSTTLRKLPFFD